MSITPVPSSIRDVGRRSRPTAGRVSELSREVMSVRTLLEAIPRGLGELDRLAQRLGRRDVFDHEARCNDRTIGTRCASRAKP